MDSSEICRNHMPFELEKETTSFPVANAQKDAEAAFNKFGFVLITVLDQNGVYRTALSADYSEFFVNSKVKSKVASVDFVLDEHLRNGEVEKLISNRQNDKCYNETAFLYSKAFNDRMMEIVKSN